MSQDHEGHTHESNGRTQSSTSRKGCVHEPAPHATDCPVSPKPLGPPRDDAERKRRRREGYVECRDDAGTLLDTTALGFVPFQKPVQWFSPSELAKAGVKAVISAVFGAYADSRELQALRSTPKWQCYDPHHVACASPETPPDGYMDGECAFTTEGPDNALLDDDGSFWFDYVADLGDGWDATYAMAQLLADRTLAPQMARQEFKTRRGRLLVMGGDQVYPTATQKEYANRLEGPYRGALPCVKPDSEAPHLYAIPGNHDWYDGLTSFTRLFCQERWIGGWRTRQTHSYFALKLPHNWWLWGIDVQLGSAIDEPQLSFFTDLGHAICKESGSANIVLCTAEPTWTYAIEKGPHAYDNLAVFEQRTIRKHGHRMAVGLAGDLHAYARWAHEDGRQRFISGGGGAYLYPTRQFEKEITTPTIQRIHRHNADCAGKAHEETFTLGTPEAGRPEGEALFPGRKASWKKAFGSLAMPWINEPFSLLLGGLYLFLVWLLQSSSIQARELDGENSAVSLWYVFAGHDVYGNIEGFGNHVTYLLSVLGHAPLAMLTAVALIAGLIGFADAGNLQGGRATLRKVWLGGTHATLHLLAVCLLTWAFASLNYHVLRFEGPGGWQVAVFSLEMLVIGGVVAGFIFGAYLFLSYAVLKAHANEVLSCQGLTGYKHFLRFRIDKEGDLTIYPIGLKKVPKKWVYKPGVRGEQSWFEPKKGRVKDDAILIEPPIQVKRTPVTAPPPATPAAME